MERKEFIKTCGLACLGTTALMTMLQGCASSNYFAKTSTSGKLITIPKSEFTDTSKDKVIQRKFVLVRVEKFNYPIGVYHLGDSEYSALMLQCTHKGCELQPNGDFLVCPCHGSEFTNTGVVQNPPAEENLQTFKTSTDNENIYIHI